MITKADIIADMHTHTIFSLHAHSTIKENVESAKSNGLRYIAITDHYYGEGTKLQLRNEANRISNMERCVNSSDNMVYVIGGAEFNLGQIIPDWCWEKIRNISWKPIGIHKWFMDCEDKTLEQIFHLFENAARNHNAFAHIERELHKVDHCRHRDRMDDEIKDFLSRMVYMAKENDVYLELNEASVMTSKNHMSDKIFYWLTKAKQNRNKIYLGSDAHYCGEVGIFCKSVELLNKMDYPKELILNCSPNDILSYVHHVNTDSLK